MSASNYFLPLQTQDTLARLQVELEYMRLFVFEVHCFLSADMSRPGTHFCKNSETCIKPS